MGHLLHVRQPFPSPPSTDLKLLKIKHLLHAFVLRHGGRLAVALGGAKSLLLDLLSSGVRLRNRIKRRKSKKPRRDGGDGAMTMRLKLLLPASVLPPPSEIAAVVQPFDDAEIAYYDSSWNTMIPAEQLPPITGYLSWPENDDDDEDDENGKNEIDMLADKFIARCHERFMLEKQESYRRFQEMLARSL